MIIKSMTRKDASFGQLVRYIGASASEHRLYANLMKRDSAEIVAAFRANAGKLPVRANGVTIYHEVISITRSTRLDIEVQKDLLHDIAERYVAARARRCMVYGALHDDKAHSLHYHLLISANREGKEKRHRLNKAEFVAVQRDLEAWVLRHYPQLEQTRVIGCKRRSNNPSVKQPNRSVAPE